MKLLRITGLIIFLFSTIAFAGFCGYEAKSKDTTGPEIRFEPDVVTAGINVSNEELLQDVTAYDEDDGDVTKSVIIEDISDFTGPNKRIITYAAFDSNNNITKRDRELIYTDYTPVRFSISKTLSFNIGEEESSIMGCISAIDCIDGDLNSKIKYELPNYDFGYIEGKFRVKFMVTNSAGDTAYLPADIEFHYPNQNMDRIPQIQLSKYLIYIKAGENLVAGSYLKGVVINREEHLFQTPYQEGIDFYKDSIMIDSNVDTGVPGVYEIDYSMTTEDDYTGTAKLIVIVEE